MFFRLLARAPRMTISPFDDGRRAAGVGIERSPRRYAPVSEPWPSLQQLRRLALEDHVAAELARARTEIDHVVRGADRFLVVLDDDDGVAEIAQTRERGQQLAVVALMQADRRLVEHVEDAGEIRADLRGQPDTLALATRERGGAAVQREISDTHVVEKPQTLANLAQHAAGDHRLALGELERVEQLERFADRQIDVVSDAASLDLDRQALRLETKTVAGRALAQRAIRLEILLHRPRALFVAAAQVRDDAFESLAERIGNARLAAARPTLRELELLIVRVLLVLVDGRLAFLRRGLRRLRRAGRAVQHQIAMLLRQLGERRIRIDAVGLRQRHHRFAHQLAIAARPRRDRTAEQRQRLIGHDEVRIEVVGRARGPDNQGRRRAVS